MTDYSQNQVRKTTLELLLEWLLENGECGICEGSETEVKFEDGAYFDVKDLADYLDTNRQ